jgi:hypothetical protein
MANVLQNRISTTFSTTDEAALTAQHAAYSAVINPKMVTLTDEELKGIPSIDVDNYVFVNDTITTCDAEGVAMLPPNIAAQVPEMVKDYTFYKQLHAEIAWLQGVLDKLKRSQRLAAAESYTVANKIYEMYASLADAGVPGAQAKYNYLKARYKGNGPGRPQDAK